MGPWRASGTLCLILGLLWGIGCDRTPGPPKAVTDAQNAAATLPDQTRPTTQELLDGKYRKFVLPDMPLSMMAPDSWKFSTAAGIQFVEGPTPTDQAIIQVARRDPVPADRLEPLLKRLQAENDSSGPLSRSEVRESGPLHILERVSTSRAITNPKLDIDGQQVLDAQGNPITITSTPLQWSLSAFILEGQTWNRFELNVIGLTTDQYATDKPLLEKIFKSLTYESSLGARP